MCNISQLFELFISMTSLQNQVFLASYSWTINFMNVCSNSKLYAIKLWHSYWKMIFEYDTSINTATTNLIQQNLCMANGIILVSNIPYCVIYYSLYSCIHCIPYCNCLSVNYIFINLIVLTVIIVFVVNLFLTVLDIFWCINY